MTRRLLKEKQNRQKSKEARSGKLLPPISRAMLAPPPPPRWGMLRRSRLLLRLDQTFSHSLVFLVAPAGYGKTVLLLQWLDAPQTQQQSRAAWLTLDQTTRDPLHLVNCLSHAASQHLPETTLRRIGALLTDPQPGNARRALTLLLNAIADLPAAFLLVLDDVHFAAHSRESLVVLDQLLSQAPANLHLIFVSRHNFPLPSLSRLLAQGRVLSLTTQDLRFTPAESAQLFADIFDAPLNNAEAETLTRRAEGWPVALSLIYQMGRQSGPAKTAHLLRRFGGRDPQLYNYLLTVVLKGQPESLQHFLTLTSIFNHLEPALCNALLKTEQAALTLSNLERQGLFTLSLNAERSVYRYHALFREFLQHRLLEVEGPAAVRRLHRRAAALFLEQRDDEQAIEHLLSAQDYDAAADLIYPLQNRLFPTSRYNLMEHWLAQFPPGFLQNHPWLLLTQAKLNAVRSRHNKAQQLYRQSEPLFRKQKDRAGLYDVYHDLANIAQDLGNFEQALTLYKQALTYSAGNLQQAIILGQIALCLYIQGGHTQTALDMLAQAMTLVAKSNNPLGKAGLWALKGKILFGLGRFAETLEAWQTALDLMEAYGNRHQQIRFLSNSGYLHILLGQFDRGEAFIRQALEMAQTYDRPVRYSFALNMEGELYRQRGDYSAARACHQKALAIQQQLGEQHKIPSTLNWLGAIARHEGRLAEALRLGNEGLALREQLGTEYETGLSLIDVGATCLAMKRPDKAKAMWQRALDIFTTADARYEQAQLHFYLAVLAWQQHQESALVYHLQQSFNLSLTFEWGAPPRCLHFFIEEAAWTAPLLAYILEQNPLDCCAQGGQISICANCLLSRLGTPAVDALLPLLNKESPAVRARAAVPLGRLAAGKALKPLSGLRRDSDATVRRAAKDAIANILAVSPAPLRVQCLGRFRLWRGETEITHWERSAARAVFQYLLVHRTHPVTMDRLTDIFWPNSAPVQARKNLHQAAAALRRTLEPELATGMPSRYLHAGEGTYTLNLPDGSSVDYETFETQLRPLLQKDPPPKAETLAQTLSLYQGSYLPENLYEEWTILPRERLQNLYLSGLQLLARLRLPNNPHAAADAATRALELDPWDEEAVFILMKAYHALGNTSAALRAYNNLRARLQRDLELLPRNDLTAFYKQLRRR